MMRIFCGLLISTFLLRYAVEELNAWYINYGLSLNGIVNGRLWQLVTHALLHGSWFHLVMNLLPLYFLGVALQKLTGRWQMLAVIAAGCLLGGVGHLLMSLFLAEKDQAILVGVSGGMMAVLVCLTYLKPYSYLWKLPIRLRNLGTGLLVSSLLLALMHPLLGVPGLALIGEQMAAVGGSEIFRVSHVSHFFGGVAGALAAALLREKQI